MAQIQFSKRYDHHVGNGTQELYAPGDFGEFDEKLANSLVYEGYAVFVSTEGAAEPESPDDLKSEGDAPENKALKGPAENKRKK